MAKNFETEVPSHGKNREFPDSRKHSEARADYVFTQQIGSMLNYSPEIIQVDVSDENPLIFNNGAFATQLNRLIKERTNNYKLYYYVREGVSRTSGLTSITVMLVRSDQIDTYEDRNRVHLRYAHFYTKYLSEK